MEAARGQKPCIPVCVSVTPMNVDTQLSHGDQGACCGLV